MYTVYNNVLPNCIQMLFKIRDRYNLRGLYMFIRCKTMCLWVNVVNIWNTCDEELKVCNTLCQFKNISKNKVINNYDSV